MSIPSSSITLYKSLQAQSKPYHQVEGVRWRRDWRDVPALSLASLILLAWIIAAAYVAGQRTTLPLTYWHTRYHGVLDNGNYNTLIAVAGGLAGALVCFGLAQAVKDVLRKEALSENGISLSKYSTLTKLANQGIEIRWHVSALLPLALFVLINLFGAATQAAFGASIAKYNITVPFPLMRLSSNAAAMTQTLSFRDGSNPVLYTAELNDAVQLGYSAWQPGNDGIGPVNIEKVDQALAASADYPALPFYLHMSALSLTSGTLANLSITEDEVALIDANYGSNMAFAPIEGFSARTTCKRQVVQITTAPLTPTFLQYNFTLPDCKEGSSGVYDRQLSTAFDAYACQDGSSNIYIFELQPSAASAGPFWVCHVDSLTSTLYQGVFSQQGYVAKQWGTPSESVNLSFTGDIVAYSGYIFWNTFYLEGSSDLKFSWTEANLNQIDFVKVLEWTTATITSMVTAKLADVWGLDALIHTTPRTPAYVTEEHIAQYQVQALKIHLAGAQFAWMLLPACLLALMLWLIAVYLLWRFRAGGRVDLTDPCTVLLIAGAGPEEPLWRGASTGEFAQSKEKDFVRIKYGVDAGNEQRLILAGDANQIARSPELGERFK